MSTADARVVAPGPELDALVAEHVMGEPMPVPVDTSNEMRALSASIQGNPLPSSLRNWMAICHYDSGDVPTWTPMRFSTDDGCAMRVVDRMHELGYGFLLDHEIMVSPRASFPWSYAPTRPLAICIAALRALGHDVVLADGAGHE